MAAVPSPQSVLVERLSANRERFNEALAGVPDVADRRNKGQQFNAYDLDDEGERKALCIGPITSRPLSLVEAPADVADLMEAALRLASDSLLAAAPAPSSLAIGDVPELDAIQTARLIASAPDLLEALREARDALHQHYVDWDGEPEDAVPLQLARAKCEAAIAKATAGETRNAEPIHRRDGDEG